MDDGSQHAFAHQDDASHLHHLHQHQLVVGLDPSLQSPPSFALPQDQDDLHAGEHDTSAVELGLDANPYATHQQHHLPPHPHHLVQHQHQHVQPPPPPQQQQQQQPQSATGKRAYKNRCKWPVEDKLAVVQTLVDQRALGHQAGGGFTMAAWNAVADALAGSELRSGGDVKGAEECRSAYSRLKREYVRVKQLKAHFPWNEELQRPDVTDLAKRDFLRDHPVYTSVFSGWPYIADMDTLNAGLPAVASAISKPLQAAAAPGSARAKRGGDDHLDEGSHSDSSEAMHADPDDPKRRVCSSSYPDGAARPAKRRRGASSSAATVDPSLEGFALSPSAYPFAAHDPNVVGGNSNHVQPHSVSSSTVRKEPVDARHAARTLLWSDMLSDDWSLTDHDVIVILQRFDENSVHAETYHHIPTLKLRVMYLERLIAGDEAVAAENEALEGQAPPALPPADEQ